MTTKKTGSLYEITDCRTGHGKERANLVKSMAGSKEMLRVLMGHIKGVLIGQIWDDLSIKIIKDRNELSYTDYKKNSESFPIQIKWITKWARKILPYSMPTNKE